MCTDDIFGDMDKQISAINDAVRNNTELTNSDGERLFEDDTDELIESLRASEPTTITKSELKEATTKLGGITDAIQIIKVARKQDFGEVKSDEQKLLDWAKSHPFLGGEHYISAKITFKFSYDELQTLNVFDLISQHDSYWAIDFVKATIETVRSEHTGFKFKCGKCERYIIPVRQLKEKIRVLLHLDEDDAFGDQMIKLFGDVIDWEEEVKGKVDVMTVIDTEVDMKKELMGYDYDGLKDLFEWSDEDMLKYHVLHFTIREKAREIISAVRMLINAGYTPETIGLKIEDNWVRKIPALLGLSVERDLDNIESVGLEDGNDWNDDLEEMEGRLDRENDYMGRGEKSSITLKGKTNAVKPISIMDKDGEVYSFESKSDCMKFLNTSSATFSKFLKGQSKLNKIYEVL